MFINFSAPICNLTGIISECSSGTIYFPPSKAALIAELTLKVEIRITIYRFL